MTARQRALISIIKRADKAYYQDAEPIMTDSQYDTYIREYRTFDHEFEDFQPGLTMPLVSKLTKGSRDLPDTVPVAKNERYNIKDDDTRWHIVLAVSKWTVWYDDYYQMKSGEVKVFSRFTNRINWDIAVEQGELIKCG